jgi:hypothetical protein
MLTNAVIFVNILPKLSDFQVLPAPGEVAEDKKENVVSPSARGLWRMLNGILHNRCGEIENPSGFQIFEIQNGRMP